MNKYEIKKVSKYTAEKFLDKFHYLHLQGFSFRSGYNFGLFNDERILIGIAIYHSPSVPEILQGAFGAERNNQQGIFELGRLALNPFYYEKNLTSYFLSRTIKMLRKYENIKALISYADAEFHNGYIYQATNFLYFGMTAQKNDFWILEGDNHKKHQRGKIKGMKGEWRPRSRKHRYMMIFDKHLKVLWNKECYPKGNTNQKFNNENEIKGEPFRFIPIEMLQQTLF